MLHLAAVEPATLELLKKLQSLPELRNTRLVGGAALVLQDIRMASFRDIAAMKVTVVVGRGNK